MQDVFRAIGRLTHSHITVLIHGESGTGKELVAKTLHCHSPRSAKPFISLNIAAVPKDLLASELFGHEKWAFTGSVERRVGRLEQANGGTLFLDEIGNMPAELQPSLLRILSHGEFYPVGAHASINVNVRIIAATHQNLEKLVEQGRFREDLFHRLNVIRVNIPALRERRQDIPLLLQKFLQQAAHELEIEMKTLKPEVESLLTTLDWRGNVRQLENFCRWITVMASNQDVQLHDLPPEILPSYKDKLSIDNDWKVLLRSEIKQHLHNKTIDIAKQVISTVESILIESALEFTGNKKQEAAIMLGYGRNTLTRKANGLMSNIN
jgi:two-component system nitrogen regulation response regulator GlnG